MAKPKFLIFLSFLALIAFSSCSQDSHGDDNVVRLAYLPITHSLITMIMALDSLSSPDDPYRIELTRFSSWPDVVDAMRAGRVDGASILFEVALQARENGDAFVMLALAHRSGNVFVVDNSIETYADLIGTTVAIPHRLSPQHTLLLSVLERENISINDLRLIEISPAEMPFTMASGAISAFIVAEPFGSVAEISGVGRILETSDDINPDSICCVMVFREQNDEAKFEWALRRFEEASHLAEHSEDSILRSIFREHSNSSDEVISQSFEHITFNNLTLTEEEYNHITSEIIRFGILESVPNFGDFALQRD